MEVSVITVAIVALALFLVFKFIKQLFKLALVIGAIIIVWTFLEDYIISFISQFL